MVRPMTVLTTCLWAASCPPGFRPPSNGTTGPAAAGGSCTSTYSESCKYGNMVILHQAPTEPCLSACLFHSEPMTVSEMTLSTMIGLLSLRCRGFSTRWTNSVALTLDQDTASVPYVCLSICLWVCLLFIFLRS